MHGLTCLHISLHILYIQISQLYSWENGIHFAWGGGVSPALHSLMVMLSFTLSIYLCSLSRVDVPMGGAKEVYTSLEQKQEFSYANVRKATYRGSISQLWIFKVIRPLFSIQVLCNRRNFSILVLWCNVLYNVDQGRVWRRCWDCWRFDWERYVPW